MLLKSSWYFFNKPVSLGKEGKKLFHAHTKKKITPPIFCSYLLKVPRRFESAMRVSLARVYPFGPLIVSFIRDTKKGYSYLLKETKRNAHTKTKKSFFLVSLAQQGIIAVHTALFPSQPSFQTKENTSFLLCVPSFVRIS